MIDVLMADLLKQKITLSVQLKNLTSGVVISPGARILSIGDKSCCLELPPKSCSLGHQIHLCFTLKNHALPARRVNRKDIEVIGKVEELAQLEGDRQEVSMDFNQFVNEEWQVILDYIQGKQETINSILEKLRFD